MNKKELAEQILRKHIAWDCSDSDIEYYKQLNGRIWNGAIAAIIEAMGKPESGMSEKHYQLFKENFIAHADRLLRDRGASSKDTFECLELTFDDLKVEAMGVQPGMRWVKASDRLPEATLPNYTPIAGRRNIIGNKYEYFEVLATPEQVLVDGKVYNRNYVPGDWEWLEEAIEPKESK